MKVITVAVTKKEFEKTLLSMLFYDELTYRERDVLLILTKYPEINTEVRKEICESSYMSPQYLNNMIKKLKDKGFLARKEDNTYVTTISLPEKPDQTSIKFTLKQ